MTELDDDEPRRVPGLYRMWELAFVLRPGADYRIERAGETLDGCPLVALYQRPYSDHESKAEAAS